MKRCSRPKYIVVYGVGLPPPPNPPCQGKSNAQTSFPLINLLNMCYNLVVANVHSNIFPVLQKMFWLFLLLGILLYNWLWTNILMHETKVKTIFLEILCSNIFFPSVAWRLLPKFVDTLASCGFPPSLDCFLIFVPYGIGKKKEASMLSSIERALFAGI